MGSDKFSVFYACTRIGLQGLFRSHGANVARLIPEVVLKFVVHDQLRILCGATGADPTQISTSTRVAAASATGILRTALLQPLSVIRTRLAADVGVSSVARSTVTADAAAIAWPAAISQTHRPIQVYHGLLHCAAETFGREGFRGLYRGTGVTAVTTVPYLTICFGTYDALARLLPSDKNSIHRWWFPIAKMGTAAGILPSLVASNGCVSGCMAA
jgi:hypothetical protein